MTEKEMVAENFKTGVTVAKPPPLESGDRLTRIEFERRYQEMPHIKKAELIEGVVYMPSPIRFEKHAEPHAQIIIWLGAYHVDTPGVRLADNATIRLDMDNEVQPDALLRLDAAAGGRSQISPDDYIEGAPELIVRSLPAVWRMTCMIRKEPTGAMACKSTWCGRFTTGDWTGFGCKRGRMCRCPPMRTV